MRSLSQKSITLLTFGAALTAASSCLASFTAQDYMGKWKTEAKGEETKTATVEIKPCSNNADNLCGNIVALEEPNDPVTGAPKTDQKNKNKDLRDRHILGLEMIKDLQPKKKGGYSKGTIYSPKTGKTYRASMKLKDANTMHVTGHVFVFSRTQTWTRVNEASKD